MPMPTAATGRRRPSGATGRAGKTAEETAGAIMRIFQRLDPALRRSATFDNDTAFARHGLLRQALDLATARSAGLRSLRCLRLLAEGRRRKQQRPITKRPAKEDRHRHDLRPGTPGHPAHAQPNAAQMPGLQNTCPGPLATARTRRQTLLQQRRCTSSLNPQPLQHSRAKGSRRRRGSASHLVTKCSSWLSARMPLHRTLAAE